MLKLTINSMPHRVKTPVGLSISLRSISLCSDRFSQGFQPPRQALVLEKKQQPLQQVIVEQRKEKELFNKDERFKYIYEKGKIYLQLPPVNGTT